MARKRRGHSVFRSSGPHQRAHQRIPSYLVTVARRASSQGGGALAGACASCRTLTSRTQTAHGTICNTYPLTAARDFKLLGRRCPAARLSQWTAGAYVYVGCPVGTPRGAGVRPHLLPQREKLQVYNNRRRHIGVCPPRKRNDRAP